MKGHRGKVVLALVVCLALPAAATGRRSTRPNLQVASGRLSLAAGTLSGSFTVINTGRSTARSSTSAAVEVLMSGRQHVLGRFKIPPLKAAKKFRVTVSARITLAPGSWPARVCADQRAKLTERSESDNCRSMGTLTVPEPVKPVTPTPTDPGAITPPATPGGPAPLSAPDSTFTADKVFQQDNYYAYVPAGYDRSHRTPIELFVWLHGCGGSSADDIGSVADYWPDEDYIAITPIGPEDAGHCWLLEPGPAAVLSAIANVASHFNINPRKVVLGGYSSGGDLAYRTGFYNARSFAGLLVMNTAPFRDTGSTQAQSLAAAAWKLNIVHIAHLQDATYPIDQVRQETDAVKAAGFPLTRIERKGTHYDDAYDPAPTSTNHDPDVPGTYNDIQQVLIPYLRNDWLAPAG